MRTSRSVTVAADDVGHWNADGKERVESCSLAPVAERYELGHRVRRTQSAAVLRALLARHWKAAVRLILFCSFRKEECCSMRVHFDEKRLDGVAIAFVVIALLIVIAFAY